MGLGEGKMAIFERGNDGKSWEIMGNHGNMIMNHEPLELEGITITIIRGYNYITTIIN